jgi:hypothetical protein
MFARHFKANTCYSRMRLTHHNYHENSKFWLGRPVTAAIRLLKKNRLKVPLPAVPVVVAPGGRP